MSLNLDAGAFVVSGKIDTPSAGTTVLLQNTPCELDIAGFQVYAGTASGAPSSFNIKVTPPATPAVYARTYNYNNATGKNIAISSVATDGTTLTFTVSGNATLAANDVIAITGSTLPAWNLKDVAIASVTNSNGLTTSFTVKYPETVSKQSHTTGWSGIATPSSSNISISGSVATYITDFPHGLKTGDKVTISGLTTTAATGFNISTALAVTVNSATSFSATLPSTTNTTNTTITGAAKILATVVSNASNSIVVAKGKIVDAVQLVTEAADFNVAPNFAQGTAYYAYVSDQVLPIDSKGTAFGAATNLGNGDARLAGKISTGSKVELEVFAVGASLADLAYGVEFKKK